MLASRQRKKVIGGGGTQSLIGLDGHNQNPEFGYQQPDEVAAAEAAAAAEEEDEEVEEEEEDDDEEEEDDEEDDKELWITVFLKHNKQAKDAPQILDWYQQASPKAENPYLVIEVNDNVKMVFKYIIGGMINAKKINTDIDLIKTITDLITYFKGLKKVEQESEFIIFELILKASELINAQKVYPEDENILQFDKSFIPIPINTVTDEDDAKKALVACGKVISNTKVVLPFNYAEDFSEHFKPQFIDKLGINDYLGVKNIEALPLETYRFIKLLKLSIKDNTIEKLNDLQDISESKPFDLEANYNYTIKVAYHWVEIVTACLYFITITLGRYEKIPFLSNKLNMLIPYLLAKIKAIKDFAWLMVINGIYKNINRKGLEVPKNFFHDFLSFYNSKFSSADNSSANIRLQCTVLKWFFSKLSIILKQSEILEIKTSECFYDLFDSIDLDKKNIDTEGKIVEAVDETTIILRTIHFRTDFIIAPTSITIDGFVIPKTFWLHIDKTVCVGKKPFSVFLGILNDATKLEPFFYTLLWELGSDFIDDDVETLHKMAAAVGALQDTYCTELNPVDLPKSILRAPNDINSSNLHEASAYVIFFNDITLIAEILFTSGASSSYIEKGLKKCGEYTMKYFGTFPALSELTERQIGGYNALENVVFEIAKFYDCAGDVMSDVITRSDLMAKNFPIDKVYQIHLLIQHKPAYVQIENVFMFILYLLECINFSITNTKGGMNVEQEIQLNPIIVTNYSHLLLNETYFNFTKAYEELPTAANLAALNSKYEELAKDQTAEIKMLLALAEMQYSFTEASRDNFIAALDAVDAAHEKKANKEKIIVDAGFAELQRNSTRENRHLYREALESFNAFAPFDEKLYLETVFNIAIEKMIKYLSKESVEEFNGILEESSPSLTKHNLKQTYTDIHDRYQREYVSTISELLRSQLMPNFISKGNTNEYFKNLEVKTEIVKKIMVLDSDVSKETITDFRKAINDIIKIYKILAYSLGGTGGGSSPWLKFYQNILLKKAELLKTAFFSGDYMNSYNAIYLIIDYLKEFNDTDYPAEKAQAAAIKKTIDEEWFFLKNHLYMNLIIETRMPVENKDFKQLTAISKTQNSMVDDISAATLENFAKAINAMINIKTERRILTLADKWKDYHINILYELLKFHIPRVYDGLIYTYRVELIPRIFALVAEIKRLSVLYLKPSFIDETELLIENLVINYEKKPLLRPHTTELLFDNPPLDIPKNLFVYFKSRFKKSNFKGPGGSEWEGFSKLDIFAEKIERGEDIIEDLKAFSTKHLSAGYEKKTIDTITQETRKVEKRQQPYIIEARFKIKCVQRYYLLNCMIILEPTKNSIDNYFNFFSDLTADERRLFTIEESNAYFSISDIQLKTSTCDTNSFLEIMSIRYRYSILLMNLFKTFDTKRIDYYKKIAEELIKYNNDIKAKCHSKPLWGDLNKYSKDGVELQIAEISFEYYTLLQKNNDIIEKLDANKLTPDDDASLIEDFNRNVEEIIDFFGKINDAKVSDILKIRRLNHLANYLEFYLNKKYTAVNTINKTLDLLIQKTTDPVKAQLVQMKADYVGKMAKEVLIEKYKDFKIVPVAPIVAAAPLTLPTFTPKAVGTDFEQIPVGEKGDGESRRLAILVPLFSKEPLRYAEDLINKLNELFAIRPDKLNELVTFSKRALDYYLDAYKVALEPARDKENEMLRRKVRLLFSKIQFHIPPLIEQEIRAKLDAIEHDDIRF